MSKIEALYAAQEGWFWPHKRHYWRVVHLPGPAAGWSLCGASRLGHPANHLWRQPKPYGPRRDIGRKCLNCQRLEAARG